MRFIFKTDYDQDIRIFKHSGYWYSYSILLLVLAAAPFLLGNYLQSQLVFVFIYAIVGVSLMILVGFTGQASLGHAAFLAIGAYTSRVLPAARRAVRRSTFRLREFSPASSACWSASRRCGCRASTS